MNIYVSTGGFKNKKATDVYKLFKSNGIKKVEFSGGKYIKNFENKLGLYKNYVQFHNYFPPAKDSFVFNLSSNDKVISKKSINLVKKNILLSKKIGAKFYSFHAGFRVDPKPVELGKKIKKTVMISKKNAEQLFTRRLKKLAIFSKKNKIKLLIENNVVSKKNLKSFKGNPFLLSKPNEIKIFFKKIKKIKNVGFLLDVAHLKVSSKTLKFDLDRAHKKLKTLIDGYHLSDNNGKIDSNKVFTSNSWFWRGINKKSSFYTIEVYNQPIKKYKKLIQIVKKKLIVNK